DVQRPGDGPEWIAQLVTEHREELVLGLVRGLGLRVRPRPLGLRVLALAHVEADANARVVAQAYGRPRRLDRRAGLRGHREVTPSAPVSVHERDDRLAVGRIRV